MLMVDGLGWGGGLRGGGYRRGFQMKWFYQGSMRRRTNGRSLCRFADSPDILIPVCDSKSQ